MTAETTKKSVVRTSATGRLTLATPTPMKEPERMAPEMMVLATPTTLEMTAPKTTKAKGKATMTSSPTTDPKRHEGGQVSLEPIREDRQIGRCVMLVALRIIVCSAVAGLVGCKGYDGVRDDAPKVIGPNSPGTAQTSAETACAAAKPPTPLSDAKDATDIHIAGKAVFFRSGPTVQRVLKDGTDKRSVYASLTLVHAYVDATSLITVEANTRTLEATIRVITAGSARQPSNPLDGPFPLVPGFPDVTAPPTEGDFAGSAAATNFNAAGTYVFASDETSFFLHADTDTGDAILRVSKVNPALSTTLVAAANATIDNPQIANGELWFVRDQKRVFKSKLVDDQTDPDKIGFGIGVGGEPTEVFGIGYASCTLAVNDTAAFCSIGTAVERRDLTGGNPTTILDAQKSKTQADFGPTLIHDGVLFVRSEAPDARVKHVIRELKPVATGIEEKLVACGRGMVTDLTADASNVVWTEDGAGVFITPRSF
jgi:hypothetical protein